MSELKGEPWSCRVETDANGNKFLAIRSDNGAVVDICFLGALEYHGFSLAKQIEFINAEWELHEEARLAAAKQ